MLKVEKYRSRETASGSQRASWVRGTSCRRQPFFTAIIRDESGQVLPWVAAMTSLVFVGMGAMSVDYGHMLVVRKQLQASADATALVAAQNLADGTGGAYSASDLQAAASPYTSAGSLNNYNGYTVSTPVITPSCSTTVAGWGIPCTVSPLSPNMVTVSETATFPSFFAGWIGHKTLTVTATSAAAKGAKPIPANVAIVLDTTASMNTNDSNCGHTQLVCAENAIAVILQSLDPSLDTVSLFTFPAMDASTVQNDTNCSGQRPTGVPYVFPSATATSLQTVSEQYYPVLNTRNWTYSTTLTTATATYQIAGFNNDYRSSDTATSLNDSSDFVKAIGQSTGCSGLVVNDTQNTYFASTIYQAQEALIAEQEAEATANSRGTYQNVMIILSDGNATAVNSSGGSPWEDMATGTGKTTGVSGNFAISTPGAANSTAGTYPNLQDQCEQAVTAAQSATNYVSGNTALNVFTAVNGSKNDGTLVFTIAYGSPSSSTGGGSSGNGGNCASDIGSTGSYPNITPCQDMQLMSSGWPTNKTNFYSDYYAPGGDSGCQAADANNTITSLNDIAKSIISKLEEVRLVPPGTP